MKTIAVMIPTFTIEYSQEILTGIFDFYQDKDVRVIVAQTRFPNDTVTLYNYQYWSSAELMKAEQVEAVISISGLYCSSMRAEDYLKVLKDFGNRPIVSPGIKIDLPNAISISCDCDAVYYEIVRHLKQRHHCKRIAFFSANSTKSAEAIRRYNAFLRAMKDNSLEFDQNLLFEGSFTDFGAEKELSKIYKSKDQINFDAIVAANDLMANGAVIALNKFGVSVPADVKVIGFDDAIVARLASPKLSTINQNIYSQGVRVAEIAYAKITDGDVTDTKVNYQLIPLYRQSCGCVSCKNSLWVYKDFRGKIHGDNNQRIETLAGYENQIREKNKIITLMEMVKTSNTLRQFYFNLPFILDVAELDSMAVCIYKKPLDIDANDDYSIAGDAELQMYCDITTGEKDFLEDSTFNPHKEIVPKGFLESSKGMHLLFPIFSGELNYGYLVCKIKNSNYADYVVCLKIIANALSQAYEYTNQLLIAEQLKTQNSDLDVQSKTDELTKILNRRGFKSLGQRTIDIAQEKKQSVVVFFADMDGLKKINDNFGHEMGDKAIRLEAQILKNAFRSTDVVGRLSGDEFGIVAVGMGLEMVDEVHKKIDKMNEECTKNENLPFNLSVSLGAVNLESSSVLKQLLTEADKKLYEEKKLKHSGVK